MKQSALVRITSCLLFFAFVCSLHSAAQQALHRFAGTRDNISNISFSKDGSRIIVTTAGNLVIYDAGTEIQQYTLPVAGIITAALSPDNHTLLIASGDNELEIYDLRDGGNARQAGKRKLQARVSTIDFRADGRYYAIGTDDGRIAVMDAQHMSNFTTVMEAVPFINKKAGSNYTAIGNLRFIGNDRIMVFAQNGEVKAFDVNSGRQVYALEYYHNVIYSASDDAPVQCDLAGDAKRLLCSRSGNAFILDLDTYDIVGKTAQPGIRTSAIAPSGTLVLACDASHVYVYNGDLSHNHANEISLAGLSGKPDISKILISPSANKVIICSHNELFIADYQSFQKLAGK